MMREKIPSGYVEPFEETVQSMLSLLDRVKDLKFSTNTVPKPTNLKGNQVADFEGPSKQVDNTLHNPLQNKIYFILLYRGVGYLRRSWQRLRGGSGRQYSSAICF